jgi:hypothetical protein
MLGGELLQRGELGVGAEDRLADAAGELAVGDLQRVGAVEVEAGERPHARGEIGEAAGNQRGDGAMGAHGRDQGAGTRIEADAVNEGIGQHLLVEAGEHQRAFAQR